MNPLGNIALCKAGKCAVRPVGVAGKPGIKPAQASNSRAVVRSFPNLFGSVRAYMHNLNTHASYASFRERRKIMRGRPRADLGFQLASHLDGYAEIGTAYVDKLRTLIRTNDFGRFETAKLR